MTLLELSTRRLPARQNAERVPVCSTGTLFFLQENLVLGLPVNTQNYSANTIVTSTGLFPVDWLHRDCGNSLVHSNILVPISLAILFPGVNAF